MDYPGSITGYLLKRFARNLRPAYFTLDDDGTILEWGGELDQYRIPTPLKGTPIGDLLNFTEGLLPMVGDEMFLECVELSAGSIADVHFFRNDNQLWLLLLDAGKKTQHRRILQQKANELALLRDAHARILDQYLGKGVAERLLRTSPQTGAQRRMLSILFADIRGFTAFGEHRSPAEAFEMLNTYLNVMIRPVLDGGGIVDKIVGDAIMAVFGILPSTSTAPCLAVAAAGEILKHADSVAADRQQSGQSALGVGVGIATGPVIFGVLGSKDRRTLSVTGHPVNLAARLESQASSGETLIDETTFNALRRDRSAFSARMMALKGMDSPITAYGWMTHDEY